VRKTFRLFSIYDPMWILNMHKDDLELLNNTPMSRNPEDERMAEQYVRTVQWCVKNDFNSSF
jgi:hypothetical protein